MVDWLFQETKGPSPKCLLLILSADFLRHEDDGQFRGNLLDDREGVGATQAREVIVQEHEVELFSEEGPHRIRDGAVKVGGEALLGEYIGEGLNSVIVVLDDNDPHGLSLPLSRSSKEGAKW